MAAASEQPRWQLDRYREFLRMLARLYLGPQLRAKLDSSDAIQETLLKAHQHLNQFHGQTDAEFRHWLQRILVRSLLDVVRDLGGRNANPIREQSLEAALKDSTQRLEVWLADSGSSPSEHIEKEERLVRLAEALAQPAGKAADGHRNEILASPALLVGRDCQRVGMHREGGKAVDLPRPEGSPRTDV